MGIVDFLIGTVKFVGNLIFGSSSSSSIETEMFGMWFSISIWTFLIYMFIKIISKPFEQEQE